MGIDRERECALEQNVALDAHAERKLQLLHLCEAESAKLGIAEIGEAEQCIAVLIELGREPGADAQRVEELHNRHMIETAATTICEQALAQLRYHEDHAALPSTVSIEILDGASWSGRKPRI